MPVNPNLLSPRLSYSASDKWYALRGASLCVPRGKVTVDPDTYALKCAHHDIELVYNVMENIHTCPWCGSAALVLLAQMGT
jgi:hypothetical protein